MSKRFAAIWFRYLTVDWLIRRQPELRHVPFVFAAADHGRMIVRAANTVAQSKGIDIGMVVADSRAILPSLQVFDDKPEMPAKLLSSLAEWCLRYTPIAAVDLPDGLILNISGCAHLWGGERPYLKDIVSRLKGYGYDVRAAIADTIGAAWAISRFGQGTPIIEPGKQYHALLPLPSASLRLDAEILINMQKLGFYQVQSFINTPRAALRRRFGSSVIMRLDQALGAENEFIQPIKPVQPYQERLPTLEPIVTATGIEIALRRLLEALRLRLVKEGKGLRRAIFKGYRQDGIIQQIEISTGHPSRNVDHLFRLFELKISTIEPALGIELFILEAPVVEDISIEQDTFWDIGTKDTKAVAELLDKLIAKVGADAVHRYLPDEHYWPERSIKIATSLEEKLLTSWSMDRSRPIQLLPKPEAIEVAVQIPDYPPMHFLYKGRLHKVIRADGPERIEREWWLEDGLYRDYYCVENEEGARYWLFRLGSYATSDPLWFIHGFFA